MYREAMVAMNMDPSESAMVLCDSPLGGDKQRAKTAEIMFESLGISRYYAMIQGAAALIGAGRTTGLSIHIGHQLTQIVPMADGVVYTPAVKVLPLGGEDLTRLMLRTLSERHPGVPVDQRIARSIKENPSSYISLRYDQEMTGVPVEAPSTYMMAGGHNIVATKEKFMVAEALFQPAMAEVECDGIHTAAIQSILECPVSMHRDMLHNFCPSGGSSLFSNIIDRLINEFKHQLPANTSMHPGSTTDGAHSMEKTLSFKNATLQRYYYKPPGSTPSTCLGVNWWWIQHRIDHNPPEKKIFGMVRDWTRIKHPKSRVFSYDQAYDVEWLINGRHFSLLADKLKAKKYLYFSQISIDLACQRVVQPEIFERIYDLKNYMFFGDYPIEAACRTGNLTALLSLSTVLPIKTIHVTTALNFSQHHIVHYLFDRYVGDHQRFSIDWTAFLEANANALATNADIPMLDYLLLKYPDKCPTIKELCTSRTKNHVKAPPIHQRVQVLEHIMMNYLHRPMTYSPTLWSILANVPMSAAHRSILQLTEIIIVLDTPTSGISDLIASIIPSIPFAPMFIDYLVRLCLPSNLEGVMFAPIIENGTMAHIVYLLCNYPRPRHTFTIRKVADPKVAIYLMDHLPASSLDNTSIFESITTGRDGPSWDATLHLMQNDMQSARWLRPAIKSRNFAAINHLVQKWPSVVQQELRHRLGEIEGIERSRRPDEQERTRRPSTKCIDLVKVIIENYQAFDQMTLYLKISKDWENEKWLCSYMLASAAKHGNLQTLGAMMSNMDQNVDCIRVIKNSIQGGHPQAIEMVRTIWPGEFSTTAQVIKKMVDTMTMRRFKDIQEHLHDDIVKSVLESNVFERSSIGHALANELDICIKVPSMHLERLRKSLEGKSQEEVMNVYKRGSNFYLDDIDTIAYFRTEHSIGFNDVSKVPFACYKSNAPTLLKLFIDTGIITLEEALNMCRPILESKTYSPFGEISVDQLLCYFASPRLIYV
eukprot:gene15984-19013_t